MGKGVLTSFHLPEEYYADDVRAIAKATIERFGIEEWKLVVMTNEIHGHLGIYSTIGAKMGLYARERFSTNGHSGEISILSFAGSVPPISCTNDGLQISTGATVGHGLISISEEENKRVEAAFSCRGETLRLRLREMHANQIKSDIQKGVADYGHTPAYWAYVRSLAIRYWSEWERGIIFEEMQTNSEL